MVPLAPDYLSEIATQLGSVSAFFGGFAATVLALFLTLGKKRPGALIAAQAAGLAAVSFIVAVMASTVLIANSHPHAPPVTTMLSTGTMRQMLVVSFAIGMLALLVSIAASGWSHSKAMGWTTLVFSAVAIVAVALLAV